MLKSLVRELTTTPAAPDGPIPAFSTTVILKITNTRLSDAGRMVDRHQQDLFVTGSPALAMRWHFAKAETGSNV